MCFNLFIYLFIYLFFVRYYNGIIKAVLLKIEIKILTPYNTLSRLLKILDIKVACMGF